MYINALVFLFTKNSNFRNIYTPSSPIIPFSSTNPTGSEKNLITGYFVFLFIMVNPGIVIGLYFITESRVLNIVLSGLVCRPFSDACLSRVFHGCWFFKFRG